MADNGYVSVAIYILIADVVLWCAVPLVVNARTVLRLVDIVENYYALVGDGGTRRVTG